MTTKKCNGNRNRELQLHFRGNCNCSSNSEQQIPPLLAAMTTKETAAATIASNSNSHSNGNSDWRDLVGRTLFLSRGTMRGRTLFATILLRPRWRGCVALHHARQHEDAFE